jgi:hypothetical protein
MRIAYFTAGTVGAGHLVRALSIHRGLRRAGFHGEFRAFGPDIPFPATDGGPYESITVDAEELTNPFTAPDSHLASRLDEFRPDLLLVDMFWAPVMYLLPLKDCEHWLLVRRCPEIWLEGNESVPFDSTPYDRIIGIEPMERPEFTHQLEPIVICNPNECRPRSALRDRYHIADENHLTIVAHAGVPGEIDEIIVDAVVGTTTVNFDARAPSALFPLAEWLTGADVICTGAGYNSFWEAKWLGYHDRTRFTAFDRHIDDQEWRLKQCADYTPRENGADQLARWILGADSG